MSEKTGSTASALALKDVVGQLEVGASSLGWDRPPVLYSLVPTGELLQADGIPQDVIDDLTASWDGTEAHLSGILQETMPQDDLEDMLLRLAWPDTVFGAAVSVERVTVPPEVEAAAPEDEEEALEFIANHPARSDVRLTIGVNRLGESWCEVRSRDHDSREQVLQGTNLVPALVEALGIGFLPDEDVAPSAASTLDDPPLT